jgi:hypothetical protein
VLRIAASRSMSWPGMPVSVAVMSTRNPPPRPRRRRATAACDHDRRPDERREQAQPGHRLELVLDREPLGDQAPGVNPNACSAIGEHEQRDAGHDEPLAPRAEREHEGQQAERYAQ